MDVVRSDGVVIGSINGTMEGGALLLPGKYDNALSLDGINGVVRYGMHPQECFYLPEKCTTGSTYAYWLWYRTPTNNAVILDTGGLYISSSGYCFYIDTNGIYRPLGYRSHQWIPPGSVYRQSKLLAFHHAHLVRVIWSHSLLQRLFGGCCEKRQGSKSWHSVMVAWLYHWRGSRE